MDRRLAPGALGYERVAAMAEQSNPTPAPSETAPRVTERWLRLLKAYRWPLLGAVGLLSVIGGGITWYLKQEPRPEPSAQLARALQLLDEKEDSEAASEARRIASELDGLRYRDPAFPGAVHFILGILDFRRGNSLTDRQKIDVLRLAVHHLDLAREGIDPPHQLATDFALGIGKYSIGDVAGAELPLRNVVKELRKSPEGTAEFFEAAATLQEAFLDRRSPEQLVEAIDLNDEVLKKKNLDGAERDRTLVRRAQTFVSLHDSDKAAEALSQVSKEAATKRPTVLVRAQVDILARRFAEARAGLEPIASERGLDSFYPRQAQLLLGFCYEAEMDFENALRKYADVVRRFPDSAEGLAASVRRAGLLRKAQRWEEALDAYTKALGSISSNGFRNRWLRIEELRALVIGAWDDLERTHAYEFAVELARHMRPLFPPNEAAQALERVATATQSLAAQLEAELADRPYRIRAEHAYELAERWRNSGKAYAELAEAAQESPKIADVLWTSSEHYRKGHDFHNALAQMTRFINSQPRQRLPMAYVRRGEILMDLGRYDEALDHFERVLQEFPTDIATFAARYLVGACEVERNKPERAIQVWERILHDGHLDPSANEWQSALFALGRLQFQMSLTVPSQPGTPQGELVDPARPRPAEAFVRLDDAIRRLEEFSARYPNRPEAPEARFLLGKALADRAQLPRHKLKRAETDNARKELQMEIQRLLNESQNQFEQVIEMLQGRETADLLDPLSQRMLRTSYFQRAHNLYVLEKFDRAIEAYTNAANRYPEDPNVFLAYIQMANCYEHLGKPIDARGVAIQAMLIHKNMPETAFTQDKTLMNRDEWRTWLEWAGALRHAPRRDRPRLLEPTAVNGEAGSRLAAAPLAQIPVLTIPN